MKHRVKVIGVRDEGHMYFVEYEKLSDSIPRHPRHWAVIKGSMGAVDELDAWRIAGRGLELIDCEVVQDGL